MSVEFLDENEINEQELKYVVIVAKYNGKWLYCRHKERSTFEIPGGHIEKGETPIEAAKRELFEETGAVDFEITPISVYKVNELGMLYFAEVKSFDNLPVNSEIAEITFSEKKLEEQTYPEIQPALFYRVQGWLSIHTATGEVWDIMDENRKPTGRTHRRGDKMQKGDYHLIVGTWIQNSKGEFLIQKRSENKGFPNMWECQGGSATAGDSSLSAAIREAKEECGIELLPENAQLVTTYKGDTFFKDTWLFTQEFDIKKARVQEGETCDLMVADKAKIRELVANNKFTPNESLEKLLEVAK